MYMLNMVIILIVTYCNVVTAIDKIPTYLLHFNSHSHPAHTKQNVPLERNSASIVDLGMVDGLVGIMRC